MVDERTERLTVRLTERELEMVHELAAPDGVSAADALRMALRRAYEFRFGEVAARRPDGGPRGTLADAVRVCGAVVGTSGTDLMLCVFSEGHTGPHSHPYAKAK